MDGTDALAQEPDRIILVAEKYYVCVVGGTVNGIYTYENDRFVSCTDKVVFLSEGDGYLVYDEAIASMLTPEQAANCT